jgi:hypothetical protein
MELPGIQAQPQVQTAGVILLSARLYPHEEIYMNQFLMLLAMRTQLSVLP